MKNHIATVLVSVLACSGLAWASPPTGPTSVAPTADRTGSPRPADAPRAPTAPSDGPTRRRAPANPQAGSARELDGSTLDTQTKNGKQGGAARVLDGTTLDKQAPGTKPGGKRREVDGPRPKP